MVEINHNSPCCFIYSIYCSIVGFLIWITKSMFTCLNNLTFQSLQYIPRGCNYFSVRMSIQPFFPSLKFILGVTGYPILIFPSINLETEL